MEATVFKVPGVSCSHCQQAISGAVGILPGVAGVNVDLRAKSVTVTYDPSFVGKDAIRAAIEEAGYDVA